MITRVLRAAQKPRRNEPAEGSSTHDPRDGKHVGRVAGSWRGFAGDRGWACLGVYGSTVEPGRIAVNDPVIVESPA